VIADRTAYDVRYTDKLSLVSVTNWRTAGTHDPIQQVHVEFMNAPKLNPLKRDLRKSE